MISELDRQRILDSRNEIERCPCCNGSIKDRKIALYKGLIDALYRVYTYCGQKRAHELKMGEIKHLLGKNEYARFGDLIRFGGIVYRPKDGEGKYMKAHYGINMARAHEFFKGERTIPVQITLNQITNAIIDQTDAYYYEFPSLISLMKENGLYDHEKEVMVNPDIPAITKKGKIIQRPVIEDRGDGIYVAVFKDQV